MKFTRILALGLVAAAALSMNACDSTSSEDEPDAVMLNELLLIGGSQKSDYGSFFSVRMDTVYNSTTAQNHWADIDFVFFTDTSAVGTPLSFFSPKTASVKFAHLKDINVKNDTKFYPVPADVEYDEVITTDDLTAVISKIDVTKEDTKWAVESSRNFIVKTVDGKYGLVNTETFTDIPGKTMKTANITIKVLR